ncbi:PssE/Cps14G family polysaccharide biosynthesis glycosyltransferase [Metabacillus indicus]|uniref:Glycosyl transferase family 28 C-terminal domain-containing protein n=1 Tax=Metabacillus indicus TaxID=246786 RepID=A0A084GXY3_METID|nr:PssE/Cps14G family polysaccharide biosynthesis glycosyltransferase [Metabacillus indicus]KEZ52195.1 hypothetical protein GS18_0214075 [Metabacillus indicus]
MIFVTVGTQKFQFNRLMEQIDKLAVSELKNEQIVVQCGYSDYSLKNCESKKFIEPEKVEEYIKKSDLIITHAGTSSIIQGLKYKKKVVVVPRMSKFGEHVDDHQTEIGQLFSKKKYVETAFDITELAEKIELAKDETYEVYEFGNNGINESIDEYLKSLK